MSIKAVETILPNLHPFYTLFLLIFISFAIQANAAQLISTPPLQVENRSPFIQHYALAVPSFHDLLENKQARLESHFEVANYLSRTSDQNQQLFIDGETWIWTNTLYFPISSESMMSIRVPWVRHSKGQTDHIIYTFHDVLKLPQNGRDKREDDQFIWQLEGDSGRLYLMESAQSDLGDIRFNLTLNTSKPNEQINAYIELPTGRFDKQSGNDKLDIGLSLTRRNPEWLANRDWLKDYPLSIWYGTGLAFVSHHQTMQELDPNRWIINAQFGLAWEINTNWQFKSQLDSHSPIFSSDIRELGWIPVLASLGFQYNLNQDIRITMSLTEDLRPRVTPDAIFSIGTSVEF